MLYLVLSSVIWSISYGLIKGHLTSLDPNIVAFCRLSVTLPIFIPYLRWQVISRLQAMQLVCIGALQYGVMYMLCIAAYQYLQAYQVVLFAACTPLYVILFESFLKKQCNMSSVILAMTACIGASVIHFQYFNIGSIFKGFLLIQLSDMCFALGQVLYRHLMEELPRVNDLNIYALLFIGASSVCAIVITMTDRWGEVLKITPQQGMIIGYLGIVATGFAFFMWNKGALQVKVALLAVMNNIKIPLGVLASVIFFGETTHGIKLTMSMGIILGAIFYAQYAQKDNESY